MTAKHSGVNPIVERKVVGKKTLEGLGSKASGQEMDILKDLPSYNRSNFSKFTPHGVTPTTATGRNSSYHTKAYFRLKNKCQEEEPQVIVMDSESLILKELEAIIARQQSLKRVSLKRSSSCRAEHSSSNSSQSSSSNFKFPRTDINDEDSVDAEDM